VNIVTINALRNEQNDTIVHEQSVLTNPIPGRVKKGESRRCQNFKLERSCINIAMPTDDAIELRLQGQNRSCESHLR
jgi:hypothetical protein